MFYTLIILPKTELIFYDYLKVYIYSKMDNICIKYTLGRPYNELVMVL